MTSPSPQTESSAQPHHEHESKGVAVMLDILAIIVGFAILVAGARLLIHGASNLALRWGISQMVIGATIVAFGTSLPELAAIVVAAFKGQDAIGFGNIVGSNIINVLGILGAAAVIMPISINGHTDGSIFNKVNPAILIAFVAASVYLLYCLLFRGRIGRIDGLILVTAFLLYSWYSYAHDLRSNGQTTPPASAQVAPSDSAPNEPPEQPV